MEVGPSTAGTAAAANSTISVTQPPMSEAAQITLIPRNNTPITQ
jgi:hypothetical protein